MQADQKTLCCRRKNGEFPLPSLQAGTFWAVAVANHALHYAISMILPSASKAKHTGYDQLLVNW